MNLIINNLTFFLVLAGPPLPSLMPLVSTPPTDEYMLARGVLHKLDCSYKA
jgi:hypothetical protein